MSSSGTRRRPTEAPAAVYLRRLVTAGVTATLAATTLAYAPELLAPSAVGDQGARSGADAQQALESLTAFAGGAGPDHVDPLPEDVGPNAPTDTTSLYERAGLGSPRVARAELAEADAAAAQSAEEQPATARMTTSAAATPPGAPVAPGLTEHVAPSCTGTGADGNRVQVLYVHEADDPARFRDVLALLRHEVANVDDVFAVSAAKTGGGRRVRWVHDSTCVPVIRKVTVPDGALAGFGATVDALRDAGYDRPDRKYLAFTDADVLCGVASYYPYSRKIDNPNDGGVALHARVDSRCWSSRSTSVAAHELLHNLGGVQPDAPHATAYGHCTDDADLMCYEDGPGTSVRQVCASSHEALLDCNNDDYFTTRERVGSYLEQHWNTADSSFLDVVPRLGKRATAWTSTTASRGATSAVVARLREVETGRTLARMTVTLQVRWHGTRRWQAFRTGLRTDSVGRASYDVRLNRAGYFRYRFAGGPKRTASVSRAVLVKVTTRMHDRTSRTKPRVVRSRLTTVRGVGVAHARVVLQRRPARASTWRTAVVRRTGRHGVVQLRVAPRRGEAFRWVYAGSGTRHRAVGPAVVLRR